MKLVMTLLARNEADIVDAQLAFHLNAGVDFVVATDNRSEDGTTEILESYARDGYLHLIHEPAEQLDQPAWVTRMARLAATDFGADWVLNADADEFWWPRGGSLKEILAEVPERFGTVRALLRNFVPQPAGGDSFAERMTVREVPLEAEAPTPLRIQDKVVHRANAYVEVALGNHDVSWEGLVDLRGWYPIEVLHFALRSLEQCERKLGYWLAYWGSQSPEELDRQPGAVAVREGRVEEYYASLTVGDDVEGASGASFVLDTRLRDVLRSLQCDQGRALGAGRQYLLPTKGAPAFWPDPPSLSDAAAYASEITVGSARDSVVKVEERLEEAGRRLAGLERGIWSRVRARTRLSRTLASAA